MLKFKNDNFKLAFFLPLTSFSSSILLLAALEDYLIGDPWGWIHPVQVMGWIIQKLSDLAIKFCRRGWQRRLAGFFLGLLLIGGSGFFAWLIIFCCGMVNELLAKGIEVVLVASCFAGKSLRLAVENVIKPLDVKDLIQARSHLSRYVGRDTDNLSVSEILRALLETVAENTVDGVTAPLFYAIIGAFSPLGAAPVALAYKAASTLDSMIGYLREPYKDLGWFSARFEDLLTWVPCRLTVITLSLVSGKPFQVWRICLRDGVKDPSPNSGWSEAAYAAILGVQLGGKNTYQGIVKEKPLLGDASKSITVAEIKQALFSTRSCFLIWLATAVIGDILF